MSIFIKAGLWVEKQLGYKGELNLTQFVEAAIPPIPPPLPYKEFYFQALGQGVQPTLVLNNTFDITPVFSSGVSGTTIFTSPGAFPDLDKVVIDTGSSRTRPSNTFTPDINHINFATPNDSYISVKVYN